MADRQILRHSPQNLRRRKAVIAELDESIRFHQIEGIYVDIEIKATIVNGTLQDQDDLKLTFHHKHQHKPHQKKA